MTTERSDGSHVQLELAETDRKRLTTAVLAVFGWLPADVAAEATSAALDIAETWARAHRAREKWLPVNDKSDYEVSSWGRVRSVERTVLGSNGQEQRLRSKLLKRHYDRDGYATVTLDPRDVNGRRHRQPIGVHQVVMAAFVGPPPPGREVRHLDGDPSNNCLSNLAYGTHLENMADMVSHRRTGRSKPVPRHLKDDTCKRGHRVEGANRGHTKRRKGSGVRWQRWCRACAAARDCGKRRPVKLTEEQPQQKADAVYERLMKDEAA